MIECSICKANNEDRSLYCLECGQRLQPKGPSNADLATADVLPAFKQDFYQSSSKLHSPMLDIAEQTAGRKNKVTNIQFNSSENAHDDSGNGRSMGISRNGLHSPLLDGVSASNKMAHSKSNFAVEEPEYESLRSPLLKAKVPLPEAHSPTEQVLQETGTTIQSVLGGAGGPLIKSMSEMSGKNSARVSEQFLSFTNVDNLKNVTKNNAAPAQTNNRKPLSMSQSLLPADRVSTEEQSRPFNQSKSGSNKTLIVPLIFLALALKIWFLLSLGNTLFSSAPFAFDQAGQILIMILILILALS